MLLEVNVFYIKFMSRLTVSDAKNDQYYQMKVLYEEFPDNPIYSTLTKLVILSKLFNVKN